MELPSTRSTTRFLETLALSISRSHSTILAMEKHPSIINALVVGSIPTIAAAATV